MKLTTAFALFLCFACCPMQAQANSQTSPGAQASIKDPVATSLRTLLQRSRGNTLGAISAMPTDKFNYKPTPEQMTFAHLVVHMIGFNNSFCAKAADVPAPR